MTAVNPATGIPIVRSGVQLFQRAATNSIGVTAASSNNIGYLNSKTQLETVGQLTGQDPTDMYNFVYQSSGPVFLNQINIDGTTPVRVQLLDGSGTRVIADSQGTTAQQQAYAQLTSSTGLNLTNGKYVVKVTYGTGGTKTQAQNYALQINTGNNFTADYRTLASATTINNTLLAGGSLGYNSKSSLAAMLSSASGSSTGITDIFGTLALFPTNIFA